MTVSGKHCHVANFMKFIYCIFDKLYPRANLPPSLRPVVRFALELERFVCDCATPTIDEKVRPKDITVIYTVKSG